MRPRHHPTAQLRVAQQQVVVEQFDIRRQLHVAQLPEIEMTSGRSGRPAEKNVARGLQHALPAHHALAVVMHGRPLEILRNHRLTRFLDLQEQRLAHVIGHQHDEAPGADAAHSHHLENQVLHRKMTEQFAPVM